MLPPSNSVGCMLEGDGKLGALKLQTTHLSAKSLEDVCLGEESIIRGLPGELSNSRACPAKARRGQELLVWTEWTKVASGHAGHPAPQPEKLPTTLATSPESGLLCEGLATVWLRGDFRTISRPQ